MRFFVRLRYFERVEVILWSTNRYFLSGKIPWIRGFVENTKKDIYNLLIQKMDKSLLLLLESTKETNLTPHEGLRTLKLLKLHGTALCKLVN